MVVKIMYLLLIYIGLYLKHLYIYIFKKCIYYKKYVFINIHLFLKICIEFFIRCFKSILRVLDPFKDYYIFLKYVCE